ncbi:hypothetical protein HMI56_005975 [Coelomomyces lativittatus]|nr:hypothetical protein HMI56_005975 [Coelomomyces lativittatus]
MGPVILHFALLDFTRNIETEVLHVYSNVPHIREIIELMLPKLYRIVNTRVLLNQLRDSHSSSRYLIPFEENQNGKEGLLQSDKDGKDAEEILDASLGEFACPIQFSFSFPIHWRLKPMVSLNSVSASLHSLSVTNRAHTFVFISNESCIYYMLLKEVSVPSASNAVAATVMNEEESASFSSPNMNIPPNTELHGLDPVSKEFSDEVVNMILSRLSNSILHHLSTYLSRTTLCRLTPADVHFLLPIFRGPKATFLRSDFAMYGIDETFILFFRESLLAFTSVLCSKDMVTTIAQHLQLKYDVIFLMKENYKVAPFDMGFLYCSVSSRCVRVSVF